MLNEMSILHATGTWELVPPPSRKSIVGFRQVYAAKVGQDSHVDPLKSHLCCQGVHQIFGLDYRATFSHMAKTAFIRHFLSKVGAYHQPLHQLNKKNISLNGDVEEEVFMQQPPSFVTQGESSILICRLRQSLYGLKQSPRAWFRRFNIVIQKFGMTHSEVDTLYFIGILLQICVFSWEFMLTILLSPTMIKLVSLI